MLRITLSGLVAVLVIVAAFSSGMAQKKQAEEPSPLELFDQRIMPIFRSPKPSSCVQCHLSSVDLKNYILPSHEKTFASLRDQGLVDLKAPEKSKILTLIRMGGKDRDKGARLIHEKTRQAEYEAFAAWIKACCNDPKLRDLPPLTAAQRARPEKPDEVIRHARKSRVVDSFVRNIWSQRMRCFPCHTPYELDGAQPQHKAAIKKQQEFEAQYPELVERMKIFGETPEATLDYLIEKSRKTGQEEIPLLNLKDPRNSLLVLKPMSKLPAKGPDGKFAAPSSVVPITHMGGLKMHQDDQSYKAFVAWIGDYAKVVSGRYASVEELPADNWYASKQMLRLTSAPEGWKVGTPVQLFVHAWNDKDESWETEPVAFTQGTVTPRRIVNGAIFLLAPKDSEKAPKWDRENASLPRGKYLVKAYVDLRRRLAKDPALMLGKEEFVGQAEIKGTRWREGFRHAATVSGRLLNKK